MQKFDFSKKSNFLRVHPDVKKTDLGADVTALERRIDRLVYEMYGLTQQEAQWVEAEFEQLRR